MIGRSLAHYEITDKLGEGGMGAVYLARDTKLGREVALKILPDQFARDSERLARFHREARTLAALNHPNIAAIHGLESDQGVHFLVMELAQGEDLAQRIARGPIPADETVRIARDIAQGLEEAHAAGIIHRDLKPANVKVSEDGKVKVLDFGLARAFQGESTAEEETLNSPTITAAMTGAGVILGTAAYMSPEQARGTTVDRRSDIWSFGVLVFEMLTGRRVFQGDTVSDTLAGILKSDPPWDALPDDTPAAVRLLLQRCLERDRRQRLQDIGEARILLSDGGASALYTSLGRGMAPVEAARPARPARGRIAGFAALALLLGVAAGAVVMRSLAPPRPAPPTRHLEIALPPGSQTTARVPAILPDGAMVVFELDNRLWLRRLDTGASLPLPGTEDGESPFWSPDSRHVGFVSGSKVLRLDTSGGTPVTVCDVGGSDNIVSGAWGDDDRIIFTLTDMQGLLQAPARGGQVSEYLPIDAETDLDLHDPSLISGGRGVLMVPHPVDDLLAQVVHVRDGKRRVVFDGGETRVERPVWCESGHVLFQTYGTNAGVWAVAYDPDRMETTAEPFLVLEDGQAPSVSRDGTLVCARGSSERRWQLVRSDRSGEIVERYGDAHRYLPFFDVDAAGRRAAFCRYEGEAGKLWLLDLERGTESRLTFDEIQYSTVSFSHDGAFVFGSGGPTSNPMQMIARRIAVDGSLPEQDLMPGFGPQAGAGDRALLVAQFDAQGRSWNVVTCELSYPDGARGPVQVADSVVTLAGTEGWQYGAEFSPDMSLVAYTSRESGRDEVYVRRYPAGDRKRLVSTDGGAWPCWSADGQRLWYMSGRNVVEVSVQTEPALMLGAPAVLFERPRGDDEFNTGWPLYLRVGGDGESFYMLDQVDSDLSGRPLTIIENWTGLVAR